MTIELLSVLTACGIVVAFGIGFFVGIGYQKAEDVREFKNGVKEMKESYEKKLKEMKAYYEGRADRMHSFYENKMDETYKATSDILSALSTGKIDDTKFGGF